MIPLKLQLKNFLSYGSTVQTVDFAHYSLICLSGKNGHGKSALLDALTWALWGHARKIAGASRADEGVMRLGQTHMFVILDFSFNDQIYRIRREISKAHGKTHAVLEFGLLNVEHDTLIPLTDKTIRLTQYKIEQLLNLDGESFCNSAFLRQGQANEFSKKSAKDRKTILATILGLNRYDTIRTLALEKTKTATAHRQHVLIMQEKNLQELGTVATLSEKIQQTDVHLQQLALEQHAHTQKEEALAQKNMLIHAQEQRYTLLAFDIQQRNLERTQKQHALRTLVALWKKIHAQQIQGKTQHEFIVEQRSLIIRIQEHQQLLQKNLTLKEHLLGMQAEQAALAQQISLKITESIHAKKVHLERLITEREGTQKKHDDLSQHYKKALGIKETYREQKIKLDHTCQTLKNALLPYIHEEARFERRKEYYQKFTTQGTLFTQELENIRQKQGFVHDDTNPSCPLCEQNLSSSRKKMLKKHFVDQEAFFEHRITRLKKVTAALRDVLITQNAHLSEHKKNFEHLTQLTAQQSLVDAQITSLEADLLSIKASLDQAATMLAQQQQILIQEQQHLTQETEQQEKASLDNPLYQQLLHALSITQTELQKSPYNHQLHAQDQARLSYIEQQLVLHENLLQEQGAQTERIKQINELCIQLKHLNKTLQTLEQELDLYKETAQQRQNLLTQHATLEQEKQSLRALQEKILQEHATLLHEQTRLKKVALEYDRQQQEIANLDLVIDDYQIISTATSKDGIQALLIEEAIPEIEQEANQLLAKLTNNQAQLFIESLRDLKRGGTKETLDINIADDIGIRPYELFSGGEAFRIDFALRIAISKLLARRAGTSLQTLIIDEGFGSQDEEGLTYIMDALYKIQDDFQKIIIVSHLPFMKDQFPVQFLVEKGPQGSTVRVVEQG